MPLDVRASRELQAVLLGLRNAERELRTDINKEARRELRPDWVAALTKRAHGAQDQKVIVRGARVAVGAKQVSFKAATSNRPLTGELLPSLQWQGVELGMQNRRQTFQTRSPKGKRYTVTKTVGRGLPGRTGRGRVAFPASSEVGTRLVARWVQTIVDKFRSFAEIKGR